MPKSRVSISSTLAVAAALWAVPTVAASTQIDWWVNGSAADHPLFERIVSSFEAEHPDIQVKLLENGGDYYSKLTAAILGGTAPDVFYVRPGTDFHFAAEGAVYDISPLVARDSAEVRTDQFIPAQVGELTYHQKIWALPYDFSTINLFYNQDLFDAAGIAYPEPGWTWDDVAQAAQKTTIRDADNKATQFGFGNISWYYSQWAEGFIMAYGGRLFNEDYTDAATSPAATDGAVASLSVLYRLTHELGVTGGNFGAGKAAMDLNGSWSTTDQRLTNKFRFDVSSQPAGSAGQVVSATGGAWAISAGTKKLDAAWTFLKFLASPEAMRIMIVDPVRSLPPRLALMNEWAKSIAQSGQPAHAARMVEAVETNGRPLPKVPFDWWPIVGKYERALSQGSTSPKEAVLDIQHDLHAKFLDIAAK